MCKKRKKKEKQNTTATPWQPPTTSQHCESEFCTTHTFL